MDKAIKIDAIRYRRGAPVLFDGLSLTLRERRIGLVGRNGCGKSSLLRLMAGLEQPEAGQVHLAGIMPAQDRKAALERVGIVFQNPDHQIIFPTVLEEVAFGLRQQGMRRAEAERRARAALERAGRGAWADRLTDTLSQGQRQMLCLISVLAMGPTWLLLDEPFNSLDLPSVLAIEAAVAALDTHVVTVTHDPLRLRGYDRVIWLEEGQIWADGAPEQVLPAYEARMRELAAGLLC